MAASDAFGRDPRLDVWGRTPSGVGAHARLDLAAAGVFGPRMLAWGIDLVLVCGSAAMLGMVFLVLTLASLGLLHALFGLLGLLPFLYCWLFVGSRLAATPGQMLCGLMVCEAETLGPPGPARAFVWTLGYTITMLLGTIWLLVALVTRHHRALHDLLGGVVVVRRAGLAPAGAAPWAFGPA